MVLQFVGPHFLFLSSMLEKEYQAVNSKHYLQVFLKDVQFLESQVFHLEVNGEAKKVEFRVGELANDMKMLCFLGGEPSNCAHYFTTFADVNKDNHSQLGKTFGENAEDFWRPFTYARRLEDAARVINFKKDQEKKKTKEAANRQNLTNFIRNDLKSRQPLLVPEIDETGHREHRVW